MWRLLALFATMVSMVMANNVLWEQYKEKYGLSFEDHEETKRLAAFEANLKIIKDHNFDADLGKHSYWLGVNKFAYMTNEEFRAKLFGHRLLDRNTTKWTADAVHAYDPNLTDLPTSVDWRDKNLVTPVKNQGQCGSCWAFSTTGSLEGQLAKKNKKLVSLSEQNLVDCSRKFGNYGCNGGLMDNAFTYIKANGGIDTEDSYPYEARDGYCRFKKENIAGTDVGFTDIPEGDEAALTQAIATVGPISVAIDASHFSFQLYHHGVYFERRCSSARLDHGVLAVGYGTEDGKDYYLVKNSWGPSWGLKGYIKMSRNKKNNCGIATQANYPLV